MCWKRKGINGLLIGYSKSLVFYVGYVFIICVFISDFVFLFRFGVMLFLRGEYVVEKFCFFLFCYLGKKKIN